MSEQAYIVVTPVRNEEQYLGLTIASMCAQSRKPVRWVIVDDGSTDRTPSMIEDAARQHEWITVIHRHDRGFRQAGTGVVEAFYAGMAQVEQLPWNFVAKLDGDLSFPADYFERCLQRFEADPGLGIAGGTCCIVDNGVCRPEFANEPAFHVRGPTKIYRRACFDSIGGLMRAPGWDTIDQLKANMQGWRTVTLQGLEVVHHRPTGGAYGSWANWVKNGVANYVTGYDPVFMVCKCIKRLLARPTPGGLVEGVGLLSGFVKGYWRSIPKVDDPALIAYLRREQRRALMLRPSLWRS
jgi:poly-beta-1,6-N-acetyl-D-glucosamine synthase